jgi:molybdate transport system substrate-binding protein
VRLDAGNPQAATARFALYLMTPRTQAIFADYNFIPIAAPSEP